MKYFNSYVSSVVGGSGEYALLIGVAGGRVSIPGAKWLYSLRILFLWYKFEILWTTGEGHACEECEAIPLHADDGSLSGESELEGSEQGSSERVH